MQGRQGKTRERGFLQEKMWRVYKNGASKCTANKG